MRNLILPAIIFVFSSASAQKIQNLGTVFEKSGGKNTATYFEIIRWWKDLDQSSSIVKMKEMGPTDAGFPLHLVLISPTKDFTITSLKKKKKNIVFVLNGIHPGEPDGIDASMILAREIAEGKYTLDTNIVWALIPVYNIGGALNRSENYRVDQQGPQSKGFRGNSQNLDLNRDFIKMDSKEAESFANIFHLLDPDVFVDNHVSNGADYQHVMTLIASQHNRLGGEMGKYMEEIFEPALYQAMEKKGYSLVPYVNHFGETPEKGWNQFWDSPRYSSGYASLWNSFAFVPETHMLKPYVQRVDATKKMMESFLEFTATNGKKISEMRKKRRDENKSKQFFPIAWKQEKSIYKEITYKGYKSGYKQSDVSGLPRLFYNRNEPYTIKVPFYNFYSASDSVEIPKAYIIPQGWYKVIAKLKANGVIMQKLMRDTSFEVEVYKIKNYQSSARPFEGHHINYSVEVEKIIKEIFFRKGDFIIPMNQDANRFIIEVLEPHAEDSYFAWNFFDGILSQKEGFSAYVFEETAAAFLELNPAIKNLLEERKAADPEFAKSARAQLDFVYKHSPYYEPAHMQYPVYRLMK